jgi:hypothetical protein
LNSDESRAGEATGGNGTEDARTIDTGGGGHFEGDVRAEGDLVGGSQTKVYGDLYQLLPDRRLKRDRDERLRELQSLLTTELTRLHEANPYDLGVRPSRLAEEGPAAMVSGRPAYVDRTVDEKLRKHLTKRKHFVLLVGHSRAGKSRTALEAAVSPEVGLGNHVVIAPIRFGIKADTLSRIFDLMVPGELRDLPALLWLDDLHRYLDAGALTPSLEWMAPAL